MTFFSTRPLTTIAIMALMLISPMLSNSQTSIQQPYYSQQEYYRWYYQQQYQRQQPQQDPGLRRVLPAYRGYQTNQMQQAAPWGGAQTTARPAQPQTSQQPAQPVRRTTANRQSSTPVKATTSDRTAKPAPAAPRPDKTASNPHPATSGWLTSFDAACDRAQQQGKPIVVLFVHQGCSECDRMDQNLAQPGALDTLACAVKVRIEFTENPTIANRFNVSLTPTFLVLSPSGTEVYREVGALDVDRLRHIQPALENLVVAPADAAPDDATS